MLVTLKNVFSPQNVVSSLGLLPDIKTTVMDDFFKARPVHQSPMIGLDMVTHMIGTIPVVGRDGQPVPLGGEEHDVQFIAPLPIKPSVTVTARELNDLKALLGSAQSVEQWRNNKIDQLRRVVRDTTEAICSVVLTTGKVTWPRRLSQGSGSYSVDYGSPLSFTPASKITAATSIGDLYTKVLQPMAKKLKQKGVGGKIEFRAGEDVFAVLLGMAENYKSTASGGTISVTLDEGLIKVGGYVIRELSESYPSPLDGTWVPKLGAKVLMAVAVEAPAGVWYCAIDSISANNAAVQFHVVPEVISGDVGIQLIGQSKPLPARNPNTVCTAIVVD